ncbi:MAG: TerD family protein [Candidatus Competibacteraceae bacterium]
MISSPQQEQTVNSEPTSAHSLSDIFMGLGWCRKKVESSGFLGFGGGITEVAVNLDASCLLFNKSGRLVDQVCTEQLQSQCGAVAHSGDDRTGGGIDTENERISINLPYLPAAVETLVFTVTSPDEESFAAIPHAFCLLADAISDAELLRYELSVDGGDYTALILAKLYREGDEWKLRPIGKRARARHYEELMPLIQEYL